MLLERLMDRMLAQAKQAQVARLHELMAPFLRAGLEPEEVGALTRKMAEALGAIFGEADVRAGVAQSYREVFSPEELSGLAAFYNAPFAQKLNERQPEVFSPEETAELAAFREAPLGRKLAASEQELQQKVNAVIAPRVNATVPKLRAIAEEMTGGGSAPYWARRRRATRRRAPANNANGRENSDAGCRRPLVFIRAHSRGFAGQ